MITNTLIDNSNEQLKLINTIKECIAQPNCNTLKIATGYWDIPGTALIYQELRKFLSKDGNSMQLLIGTDPVVRSAQLKRPLHKDSKFPQDFIKRDIRELEVNSNYVEVVRLLQEFCKEHEEESKLQIRIYKTNEDGDAQFFHAKCYIFSGQNYAIGIIGSSNFTQKGLEDNSELNYLEATPQIITAIPNNISPSKGHINWFNEKWDISMPWNKSFLEEVLKDAPITKKAEESLTIKESPLTPYELYIKLLQYKYGDLVDKNLGEMIEAYLPAHFDRLEYQVDAVKQCFSIMKEHGGFMLADVVGLGKTVVGVLIIKHFLSIPDDDGRDRKVLIITPPAIQSAWKETIAIFDNEAKDKIEDTIDFITTGSIGNLVDDFGEEDNDNDESDNGEFNNLLEQKNYGLILIDESHKFRNNGTSMYKSLDDLIAQIGANTGAYPYIGLLSATPQNNRPDDLKNQIYLFERNHTESTLKKANSGNIKSFFADISHQYAQLIHAPHNDNTPLLTKEERNKQLKELSYQIRDCVLADILVRRTRTDVKTYYEKDIKNQHLEFPEISGPHALEYQMSSDLASLFARTMDLIYPRDRFEFDDSDFLCYYRYRAIEFFSDDNIKKIYGGRNMTADRASIQLAHIMQIMLVKRIESSFAAFKSSLRNLRQYTKNMIDMWEHNVIFVCPQINVNAELNIRKNYDKTHKLMTFDECAKDVRKKIKKLNEDGRNDNNRNNEYTRNDFKESYIDLLRKDYELICHLCDEWEAFPGDPKLDIFRDSLKPILFDKGRNAVQKLVIFTEAIDTIKDIEYTVKQKGYRPLVITAKNRKDMEPTIKANFDANLDISKQQNDYDVIITTEVLAEGINLHRANCILNYDTPWNSTRLMQRIGRVNRIGSTAPFVYVYNFMPSTQGNDQIQLVQKAHTKLQSFHTLFGEDSQVFSVDEEVSHYDLNKQVNGDESPLEKYIFELKQFKENNPERYAYIESKEDDLELATNSTNSCSYFLVRTHNMSGMFAKIDNDGKCRIIAAIDMYKEFKTDKEAQAIDLPEDWAEKKKKAERAVNQQLNKMNVYTRNSLRATKAKEILTRMNDEQTMSEESRDLLNNAYQLVNKGNQDIMRKIIAIDEEMRNPQGSLFAITQDDFDNIVKNEIENMVANVQRRYGKAQVFIGLSK